MSLLLDHGHPDARLYPLGFLWDEYCLVIERVHGRILTEANLLQHAIGSILSKKSRTEFSKLMKSLNVEARTTPDILPEP